jgi:hypothetical protein
MAPVLKRVRRKSSRRRNIGVVPASIRFRDVVDVIAALRVRLDVIAADPTCRWAQDENLAIVDRLLDRLEVLTGYDRHSAPIRASSRRRPLPRSRA